MASGDLIPRLYSQFRGVDLRGGEVTLHRSPDSLNMWKDYKETETFELTIPMSDEFLSKIITSFFISS